jgi:hypothetical protein
VAKLIRMPRRRREIDTFAVLREWAAMRQEKFWSTGSSSLGAKEIGTGGKDNPPKRGRKPAES